MKKILIVDDQPQISKILSDLFQKKGYETILALNGEIGYRKAIEEKPDLIIMDIMMPVLSGFEATRKVRGTEGFETIPVVFLTAKGQEKDRLEAESLGAIAFVTKPFSPRSLFELIEKYFESSEG